MTPKLDIARDVDNKILALYVRISDKKIAFPQKVLQGSGERVVIDYDEKGDIVGVEILGPF